MQDETLAFTHHNVLKCRKRRMLRQQLIVDSCVLIKCILRRCGCFRASSMVNLPSFQFLFQSSLKGCAEVFR